MESGTGKKLPSVQSFLGRLPKPLLSLSVHTMISKAEVISEVFSPTFLLLIFYYMMMCGFEKLWAGLHSLSWGTFQVSCTQKSIRCSRELK